MAGVVILLTKRENYFMKYLHLAAILLVSLSCGKSNSTAGPERTTPPLCGEISQAGCIPAVPWILQNLPLSPVTYKIQLTVNYTLIFDECSGITSPAVQINADRTAIRMDRQLPVTNNSEVPIFLHYWDVGCTQGIERFFNYNPHHELILEDGKPKVVLFDLSR